MKTSGLAESECPAQRRVAGAGDPIGREPGLGGRLTVGALELGAGEQFGKSGVVTGSQQRQAVEHAADRGAADRHGVALAGKSGDAQLWLLDRLDEAEAAASVGSGQAEQA